MHVYYHMFPDNAHPISILFRLFLAYNGPKIESYEHFCRTPHCTHESCGKCKLFTNTEEDDRRARREAGLKQRAALGKSAEGLALLSPEKKQSTTILRPQVQNPAPLQVRAPQVVPPAPLAPVPVVPQVQNPAPVQVRAQQEIDPVLPIPHHPFLHPGDNDNEEGGCVIL